MGRPYRLRERMPHPCREWEEVKELRCQLVTARINRYRALNYSARPSKTGLAAASKIRERFSWINRNSLDQAVPILLVRHLLLLFDLSYWLYAHEYHAQAFGHMPSTHWRFFSPVHYSC